MCSDKLRMSTKLQIQGGIHIIFFLFLDEYMCYGYSLEALRRGASNEYPQHMYSSRNKNVISIFRMKKAPYLLLCEYLVKILGYFFYFSIKAYVVGTYN